MKTIGVIPARLESTRLPRKVLLDICGKPMIQHVWERAIQADFDEVIIATDSDEIIEIARRFGAKVQKTNSNHINGTGRLVELTSNNKADLYVNIQGDEPLISPLLINDLIRSWEKNPDRNVFTAANPNVTEQEYTSPNVVKVVLDQLSDALYFSRAAIPYFRNRTGATALKHIGLYGYTLEALDFYRNSKPGVLEITESLEQLRFIEYGMKIKVILTNYESMGVDTSEDLISVRRIFSEK